jgi:hypothetical protein
MAKPNPNDFRVLPPNDEDLIPFYIGGDISKPFWIKWRDVKRILASALPSGSGVLLKTNGVTNPVQSLLNLIDGTNMTITDDGLGNITFDATGGGATYTVDNGLTESPANNFQLGGTLIQDTTIDINSYRLSLTGTSAIPFSSVNTSTGVGAYFQADNNNAIVAYSPGGSPAANFLSLGSRALLVQNRVNGATTEGLADFDRLLVSGSAGVGTGGYINIRLPKGTPTIATDAVRFLGKWSSVASSIFDANFELWTTTANNLTRKFQILPTGQGVLDLYGSGTFAGTPAYALGVDASGNVVEFTGGGGGSGTVTSVAATVPNPTNPAFSVSVPNPTTTPSIDITANGIVSQYIRGDGSLANFPLSGGGGSSLNYYLNGSVSQGTLGGVAFKQMSSTPVIGAGTNFSISSDGYIESFITDASVPNQLAIPAGNWLFEMYFQASSSGGSPRFYIEIYKLSGGTLSLIASSVANPEFITNGTQVDLYTTAVAVPSTVLLAADRIAVRVYVIHSGRTITLHTEDSNLCEVITTFSTGITALNGLTAQIQNLATGTSGTDFGITSVTDTHTFNLPTASAANRGALSSADWSTFNGKQDTLVSGTNIKTINGASILGSGNLATNFELVVAASDEVTALTTGLAKVTFRMPKAVTLTSVRASLTTAQASGSIFTVDINEGGTSILSTKLTIDNTEKTSTTAATPPVISDTSLADDAEMTIDIDQIGNGTATGLKVYLIGNYA